MFFLVDLLSEPGFYFVKAYVFVVVVKYVYMPVAY